MLRAIPLQRAGVLFRRAAQATRQALDKRTRPRGRVFPAGYHPTQTCMGATDADQDDVVLNGRARSIVDVEVVEKLEIDDAPPRGLVEV